MRCRQIGFAFECLPVLCSRQIETESAFQHAATQQMGLAILGVLFDPTSTPAISVVEEIALQRALDQCLQDYRSFFRPRLEKAAQFLLDRSEQAGLSLREEPLQRDERRR